MFSLFTIVLEVPVTLHKEIADEDILVLTRGPCICILDRNDINLSNVNYYNYYIDPLKFQCTTIQEDFYFSADYVSFLYLDTSYLTTIDEIYTVLKNHNQLFMNNYYLKFKLIVKLEKRDNKYKLVYYYNNVNLSNFFSVRRKEYILKYLFEKSEKIRIFNNSQQILNNILDNNNIGTLQNDIGTLQNDIGSLQNDIVSLQNDIGSLQNDRIFKNDITLFNYQVNDICYFKHIEKNVINRQNKIKYDIKDVYGILNNKYIVTHDYHIYPNINLTNNQQTKTISYFGGNIVSEMGLGKTLILLYCILSDNTKNMISIPHDSFVEFSDTCNYFFKLGPKKGKCCEKVINKEEHSFFCKEHKKSIFMDKKKIILKNMMYFNIKYWLNDNITLNLNNYNKVHPDLCKNLLITKSTLIICPSHLCEQWINEYYKKCDDKLKSKTHVLLITTFNQYCNLTVADILFSDIVLISYNFLINQNYLRCAKSYIKDFNSLDFINSKEFSFNMFHWHRIVFEEFHELRNMNNSNEIMKICRSFQSLFKWNISGTPFANGIDGFMDSLCLTTDIVLKRPHYQDNTFEKLSLEEIFYYGLNTNMISKAAFLFKRNTRESVSLEYTGNIINNHVKLLDFTTEERSMYDSHLRGFNNKYSKFLIQLCCHPELNSDTHHLLKNCKTLSEIQQVLLTHHNDNLKKHGKNIDTYKLELNVLQDSLNSSLSEEDTSIIKQRISVVKRNLTNEKKIYDNIQRTLLFLDKAVQEIDKIEMCPICLDDIQNIAITTCGHKFCWECFEHYSKVAYNVKCPSCNTLLNKNDVYLLQEKVHLQNDLDKLIYEIKSTKIGNIIHLVNEKLLNKNNKIIVFSQWDEILNKVGNYLQKYNINILYCKGTVYQKNKSIKLFQENDDYNIILLSSRNAASGINLTKANNIIFIEPVYGSAEYRKNIENQAIGRCVRIGNSQSINVIRFIIKDTIESDIYYNTADESQLNIF